MNAQPKEPAPIDATAATVDERNPWLGLASFTEETRAFFFGREDEVAELARRVQRKLLTVLFGQSGLGKTSILRAGLVPRLRAQGYCPVYVRIDYGKDSPEPAEQIKQAILRGARRYGEWSQAGVAIEGESLWEFLHHRDDVLRDESGATLTPLLIFDQFEEIFTLAQSDEFGRARAARFIEELSDLVENRPPKSLQAKLDEDESGAERFDFARGDYRVLIALREDYLAPLEGLKKAMPSISQNRLRLAPMDGEQALAAVLQPGKRLVTEEVAGAIVRFVAGGSELAHAEVEPSLLSLICRELNDTRIAQGRDEISLDLLAGSHASILSNFYERSLADQPPAVRQVVEDDLLTSSGFRENIAEERLLSRFKAAGAAPGTLAVLVNRRLLRIEERLDMRRVELTHDVLCGVVKSSRDLRRERESREATERLLAEQHERELATRRALVRARQIATGCIVLAAAAVVAAIFAYLSTQRAHRAERLAVETRAQAEQARAGAEHLLGYLSDDFVRELQSFGRINMIKEFSARQIEYFHSLPAPLLGAETIRNGATAMQYYARANRQLGDLDIAIKSADESVQRLEQLRRQGDGSEATAIALALGYTTQSQILDNRNDPDGPITEQRSLAILRPIAEAPGASVASRRAYVESLVRAGFEDSSSNQYAAGVPLLQHAMQLAQDLGARNLADVDMAAYYAESGAWYATCLVFLGRDAEARRVGEEVFAIADQVLVLRPGYRLALHAEQVVSNSLSGAAQNALDPAEMLRTAKRDEQVSVTLLQLDPHNVTSLNNLGVAQSTTGDALWAAGQLRDSIPFYQKAIDDYGRAAGGGATFAITQAATVLGLATSQAQMGDGTGAAVSIAAEMPFLDRLRASEPQGSLAPRLIENMLTIARATIALERDDLAEARRVAQGAVQQLQSAKTVGTFQANQVAITAYSGLHVAGRADYFLGNYTAAEQAERQALEARTHWATEGASDQRNLKELSTWLTMALAKQGKLAEAAQVIAPVVRYQRELKAHNHGDVWQPAELAAALYAQALIDPGRRAPLLNEAAALLDATPPTLRGLHDIRLWRGLISAAQRGS